jgi:aminoglycoside 6'-N-acetyltransferase I
MALAIPHATDFGAQIRPVDRPDQAEWVRMRTALWPDDGDEEHATAVATYFASNSFRWSESILFWKVFVAERPAGGLCGFVETSIRPYVDGCLTQPVGYIEGWYVDPDMRRQGIGGKLVQAAEQRAASQGCQEMASDAHLQNTVSHQAHQALGFDVANRSIHFRKSLAGLQEKGIYHPLVMPRLSLLGVAGLFAVCKLPPDRRSLHGRPRESSFPSSEPPMNYR